MSSVSSNTATPWFAVSVGLLGIMVGYGIGTMSHDGYTTGSGQQAAVLNAPAAPTAADPPAAPSTPATVDDDPIEGAKGAKVTLIEFTDFQCPFCSRHYTDTYGQIKKDYVDT